MTEYNSKELIPVKEFISIFNNLASAPKEDVLIDTLLSLVQKSESIFSLIDDPYLNAIKNLKFPENVVLNEKIVSILEFFNFYEGDSKNWYSMEFQNIEKINKDEFDKIKLGKFAKDSYSYFTQILNILEFIKEISDDIDEIITDLAVVILNEEAAEEDFVEYSDIDPKHYQDWVEDELPQINIEVYRGQLLVNTKREASIFEDRNQKYIEKTYRYGIKTYESISHLDLIELKGPKLHLLLKQPTIISYLTKIFDFDNFNVPSIYFYYQGPETLEVSISPSKLKLKLTSFRIWLAQITIPSKYFEIYQCEKEIKLKIKWKDFQKLEGKNNNSKEIRIILEEIPKGQEYTIKINDEKNSLFRTYDSEDLTEDFVQNIIRNMGSPIIEFDSIKLKSFAAMTFVQTFFWDLSPDAQNLIIKARYPKCLECAVLFEIPVQNLSEKLDNLIFTRVTLKLLFNVISPSEKIKIYLKENGPLLLEMELEKKGFILTYVQAPRIGER